MKKLFPFLFLLVTTLSAKETTVCLNMIVKNEKDVICRCLESVKPYIDTWVIVDTGSTDGTQQIIRDYLKDIPGELHERPWVNFCHNRNEALELARSKADYLLFIDADEILHSLAPLDTKSLSGPLYAVYNYLEPVKFIRLLMVKSDFKGEWKGALHEYFDTTSNPDHILLTQVELCSDFHDGARSKDPDKYIKDAQVLEAALKEDPNDLRNIYYLAQSYLLAKEYELAAYHYLRRAEMGGEDYQVFHSYYQGAKALMYLNRPAKEFLVPIKKAAEKFPDRYEPIFELASNALSEKRPHEAYSYAQHGLALIEKEKQNSTFAMFMRDIRDWRMLAVLALAAEQLNRNQEALDVFKHILTIETLEEPSREEILRLIPQIEQKIRLQVAQQSFDAFLQ